MKHIAGIIVGLAIGMLAVAPLAEAQITSVPSSPMPQIWQSTSELILVGRGGHGKGGHRGHGRSGHGRGHHGSGHVSHHRAAHHQSSRHHRLFWQRRARLLRIWIARTVQPEQADGSRLLTPVQFGPAFPEELAIGAAIEHSPPAMPVTDIAARPSVVDANLTAGTGESPVTATAAGNIDCGQAAQIISTYGFSDVAPRHCAGPEYNFDATRDTQLYAVSIDAQDGELTKVAKYDGPKAPAAN